MPRALASVSAPLCSLIADVFSFIVCRSKEQVAEVTGRWLGGVAEALAEGRWGLGFRGFRLNGLRDFGSLVLVWSVGLWVVSSG
ncbi:hypothetical protein J1N35_018543 [Gossypium stocksii]|uniref:Secreted protein n=1 Tax=Gossypium stocksii TaxID=47602 RepID=A0A9D4A7C0_9ROSI|nr:hypothetical protein J1N35_018543 [Gossypium stocksii]